MSKRLMAVPVIVVMMAAVSVPVRAQVGRSDRLGGRVYFDLQKGLNDINKDYLTYSFRRVYFTYNMQISEKVKGRFNYGEDGTGFWVFGRYSLPGSPVSLLARYDNWDPDTGVDDNTEILLITGLDYTAAEGLNIIPNIQLEKLGNSDTVGTFLLTFYWRW